MTPKTIMCTALATTLNAKAEKQMKMYIKSTRIKFKKGGGAVKWLKSNQYYQFLELITKKFFRNMDTNK